MPVYDSAMFLKLREAVGLHRNKVRQLTLFYRRVEGVECYAKLAADCEIDLAASQLQLKLAKKVYNATKRRYNKKLRDWDFNELVNMRSVAAARADEKDGGGEDCRKRLVFNN